MSAARSPTSRTVSFSPEVLMIYIPKERKSRSYSPEDIDRFLHAMITDALRLGTTPYTDMEEDDLYKSIGLESFLSGNIARLVLERHTDLILQGQARYTKQGLSELSQMSSRRACESAHMKAALNLQL